MVSREWNGIRLYPFLIIAFESTLLYGILSHSDFHVFLSRHIADLFVIPFLDPIHFSPTPGMLVSGS